MKLPGESLQLWGRRKEKGSVGAPKAERVAEGGSIGSKARWR